SFFSANPPLVMHRQCISIIFIPVMHASAFLQKSRTLPCFVLQFLEKRIHRRKPQRFFQPHYSPLPVWPQECQAKHGRNLAGHARSGIKCMLVQGTRLIYSTLFMEYLPKTTTFLPKLQKKPWEELLIRLLFSAFWQNPFILEDKPIDF
ncbi:MAG: hypothetical protein WBK00_10405, partial [Limnochordia bacterium]